MSLTTTQTQFTFVKDSKKQLVNLQKISKLINKKNKMDALKLLDLIDDQLIKTTFFDPQYRGVLDEMNYGNEGKRQKGRHKLQAMSEETIKKIIKEIDRVLQKSGYLFLWIDKFHLCEGIKNWFENTDLKIVDLITWNKKRMGMGYRSRRTSEYLVVLQKKPKKAKTTWKIKNIRDCWEEKISNKKHVHQKPYDLQKILIEATTDKGDYVLDPAAGSFRILDITKETKRKFLGCDVKV